MLILPVKKVSDLGWMKAADLSRNLRRYLDDGGRVLWIGGTPPPREALPDIATATQLSPGETKWPLPLDELMTSKLHWLGKDPTQWNWVRSPQSHAERRHAHGTRSRTVRRGVPWSATRI